MKKSILFSLISCLLPALALAQSIGPATLNAAGGYAVLGTDVHEWALGDLMVTTGSSPGLIITPGVLQPSIGKTGVHPTSFAPGAMTVFPNPANTDLFIQPQFSSGGALNISLLNATGQILLRKECALLSGNERQSISLQKFPAGAYVLQLQFSHHGQLQAETYRIQKR